MRREGRLIGCMVHNGRHSYFWLNERAGLKELGYAVSAIEERDCGQTEFVVTDDDGFTHCFGVDTKELADGRTVSA